MASTNETVGINRTYKDRLFRLRFGSEEYKEDMLILYNALNGTSYSNTDDIRITTLDDVIYMKMKNDISILLDSNMVLWEQQSSINPNMPARGLMYYANLLSQYIKTERYGIYNKRLIPIPTPQYVVFYNGTEEYDAKVKLRLSDAFINKNDSGDFEWTAMVYNLNPGKNDTLLEKCRPLKEYMIFINKVREYSEDGSNDIKTAVTQAVDYCIDKNIMSDFLIKHKAEVVSVCITEFDEKIYEAELREEGREEGLKKGREEGLKKGLKKGREKGLAEGKEKERKQNIKSAVKMMRQFGLPDSEIYKHISENFGISEELLTSYINETDTE